MGGFERSSRSGESREAEDDSDSNRSSWGNDDYDEWEAPSGSGTPDLIGELSLAEAKQRYDRDFGLGVDEVYRLMRMEEAYGPRVHQWVDEGIPGKAMETAETRQRFRERKDTPIPWDIEDDYEETLQRSLDAADDESPTGRTSVPDSVREVISSPGRPLDTSIQRAVEERMGDSLGDVRIHTGPKAAEAADQINARAFTVGNHVAFGAGEYDPESAEGQHVLAHELAHVRQQTGGDLSMLPQEGLQLEIDPDPELEREAEETAQRVMAGGKLGIQKLSDTEVHVQRALDRFNPLSGSSESESSDSAPVDELARRLEVVEQNQAALFESMAGDGAESGDVDLEALVDGDQKGALERVGEAGTYGALGELVKAGGTEALKQGAMVGGLATAGSVGLPVALAAGVVAATAASGTVSVAKNRGSILEQIKQAVISDETRSDVQSDTARSGGKFS